MCHRCGEVQREDEFNADRSRRYLAKRKWNSARPSLLVLLANPAKYDASGDNPTTRAVMGIACTNGYGSVTILNLDPRMSSQPLTGSTPSDKRNRETLRHALTMHADIWIGWGSTLEAAANLWQTIRPAKATVLCLGQTKAGFPKHPARKSYASTLVAWID